MNKRLQLLRESLDSRELRLWQSLEENLAGGDRTSVKHLTANAIAQREHRQMKTMLRQLTELHDDELPKLSLLSALQEAHVLKEKGLYDHALSILEKTHRRAMESQNWHIAGEASEEMRQIMSRTGQTDAVRENLKINNGVLDVLKAEYEAADIAQSIYRNLTLTGETGERGDMELKALQLLETGESSLKVTYHSCSALAMMAAAKDDNERRAELYAKVCSYMEDCAVMITHRPDIYASVLNNLCNAYQEMGKLHLMSAPIDKLRNLASEIPMQQKADRILFFAVRQEIDLLLNHPESEQIEKTEAEAQQMIGRWERTIHPSNVIELCLSLAAISLKANRTRKCLFWLNRLDSLTGRKLRRDMQCASTCLRMMTYLQSGDLELAQSLTRTRTFRNLMPYDKSMLELRLFLNEKISHKTPTSKKTIKQNEFPAEYALKPWIDLRVWMNEYRLPR